jgi:outer membrane protein assembly factor BamE (lipoprotein component of BamABCDE complex)
MIAIAVGMTGCASSGGAAAHQDPEKLKQIRVNKSTKQQVKSILGEPKSITAHSNETESWVYQTTNTTYTEKYAAKTALSFVPIPYLGTAVGLADRVVDVGPDKKGETQTFSLVFNKKGVLKETKKETKHF